MKFVKWFTDKYGIMIGGGSLLIVFLSFVGLAVVTRGFVLIIIPLVLFAFVANEFLRFLFIERDR